MSYGRASILLLCIPLPLCLSSAWEEIGAHATLVFGDHNGKNVGTTLSLLP